MTQSESPIQVETPTVTYTPLRATRDGGDPNRENSTDRTHPKQQEGKQRM